MKSHLIDNNYIESAGIVIQMPNEKYRHVQEKLYPVNTRLSVSASWILLRLKKKKKKKNEHFKSLLDG